jgi:phosphomannomutase
MYIEQLKNSLFSQFVIPGDHAGSRYFAVINALVAKKNEAETDAAAAGKLQRIIDEVYGLIRDEIISNQGRPVSPISFGTSGWRGMLGKDLFAKSVRQVTRAIVEMYRELDRSAELAEDLGVESFSEVCRRGAVIGCDNRFGGEILAAAATDVLTGNGIVVHYAGEATTGTLSAAVLVLKAAFSINLTPSHNPLEYGGFKFNAADAGPAAPSVTNRISENVRKIMEIETEVQVSPDKQYLSQCDALQCWIQLLEAGKARHGLDYHGIIEEFLRRDDLVVAVDCVHGASRVHMKRLFRNQATDRLLLFRAEADPTFGGVAPEPSTRNMQNVLQTLKLRKEPLKLGVIIDPDADRIRFTDGTIEIDMNMFGAMAYHYLHEKKGKRGMVAKTVATSNFANAIAAAFCEQTFEPAVGFKNFKPVIDQALVFFEESDGISVIGHTPEKDAYIGLIIALDMLLTLGKNLGDYLEEIRLQYGAFYPARGGVAVSQLGEELISTLAGLNKYGPGAKVRIGKNNKTIAEVITIDGRKIILEDGSWLMIRPSGTEPKVRFYVEARTEKGKDELLEAAKAMLTEIGLL